MNPAALMRRELLDATVPLARKENVRMKRSRLIGGILLLVAAALVFVGLDTSSSLPIAIGLAVVGIALAASGRRRSQKSAEPATAQAAAQPQRTAGLPTAKRRTHDG